MSLLVLSNSTSNGSAFHRDLTVPHCTNRRQCNMRDLKSIELYNTLILRISEMLVSSLAFLLNLLLIIAISKFQLTSSFFKIMTFLSCTLLLHSLSTIAFKALPSLLNATFTYQNEISLYVDLISRYMAILLIFVLALNRFCVLIAEQMERVLFSGWRCVILPSVSVIVSIGMALVVVILCDVDRIYVEWLGFVDSVGNAQLYAISGHCFLVFPVLSLVLHVVIYIWMRKKHPSASISNVVEEAEKQMCLQVTLIAILELLFIASFAILNVFLTQKSDFYFVISLYNILSTIPELLMPAFVLFGTKKLLPFFYICSNRRTVVKVRLKTKKTETTL